jgi:hypothetical protein
MDHRRSSITQLPVQAMATTLDVEVFLRDGRFNVSDLYALRMGDLIRIGEFLEYIASLLYPYLLSYSADLSTTFSIYDALQIVPESKYRSACRFSTHGGWSF